MSEYQTYLKTDLTGFIDEWIAIVDDKIISHNRDPKLAYDDAVKKSKGKTPMLAKIPGNQILVV